jgi:hypothetical protein
MKFLHFRRFDADGKLTARGGMTVAMHVENDNVTQYSAAFCHPKDNYCKHTGRVKAAGRLQSGRAMTFVPPVPCKVVDLVQAIGEEFGVRPYKFLRM